MEPNHRFTATTRSAGRRVYVVLPFDPDATWGPKEQHYVTGTVAGRSIRGRLERHGSEFALPLGAAWRRDNGVAAGDDVDVVLAPEEPLLETLAPDVAAAIGAEPNARAFFESVAPFYRKGYIRWIESARRPATRAARIAEAVALLRARVLPR